MNEEKFFDLIIEGNLEKLKELISSDNNKDNKDNNENKNENNEKYIINLNIQDNKGYTPLMYFSLYNYKLCAQLFIENWASLSIRSEDQMTAFLCAALEGHCEMVLYLLECGASLEDCDNKGQNALILTSLRGHTDCAAILIGKGISLNHTDIDGNTALIRACEMNHTDIVAMLIHLGANMNLQNFNGRTALMICCEHNFTISSTLLIRHGADVNITTPIRKYTALMYAAQFGCFELVSLLVENGANIDIVNAEGLTATQLSSNENIWNYLSKSQSKW